MPQNLELKDIVFFLKKSWFLIFRKRNFIIIFCWKVCNIRTIFLCNLMTFNSPPINLLIPFPVMHIYWTLMLYRVQYYCYFSGVWNYFYYLFMLYSTICSQISVLPLWYSFNQCLFVLTGFLSYNTAMAISMLLVRWNS